MKLRRTTCRAVRDLLPLHVGGDLPADRAGIVDEHLHACLTCFREYRELLNLRSQLGVLADQPLPPGILDGFTEEVMARIAVGEPGPRAALPRTPDRLGQFTRLAAAAVLLLAVGLGFNSFGPWAGTRDEPGSAERGTQAVGGRVRHAAEATPLVVASDVATPVHRGASALPGEPAVVSPSPAFALRPTLTEVELISMFQSGDWPALGPMGLRPEPGRILRPRER